MSLADFIFGTSSISQQETASLSVVNNVLQSVSNTCTLSCQNSLDNITIVISGSTVGNITIDQTCAIVGSKCVLQTTLDAQITNILKAQFTQTAANERSLIDALGSTKTSEDIHIEENVRNNVTQLVSNVCNLGVSNSASNVTFIAKDGASAGNYSLIQNGSISQSDCMMTTTAQTILQNSLTAKGDQTAVNGTVALLAMAAIIIAVIIGLCFVVGTIGKAAISRTSVRQVAVTT